MLHLYQNIEGISTFKNRASYKQVCQKQSSPKKYRHIPETIWDCSHKWEVLHSLLLQHEFQDQRDLSSNPCSMSLTSLSPISSNA